jgi:hypothetical protein
MSRTLVVWGAVLVTAAGVARGAPFLVTFVATMVSAGLVDMAMNAAAAAGVRGDTRAMMRFHALFNAGALTGAATAGGLIAAGLSWRWTWAAVGVGGVTLAIRTRTAPPVGAVEDSVAPAGDATSVDDPGAATADAPSGWLRSVAAIRSQHLGVLATAFALTAMVEGGIDTWGVLYLRTHLAAGVLLGAGAYCIGQAIAVSTRVTAGGPIGRIGPRWGLVAGAGVAAAGLALEAGSTQAAVAGLGLVLAAGGISLCWPLVMAMASTVAMASTPSRPTGATAGDGDARVVGAGTSPAVTPAALVGALTAAGYAGWVAGPAVVGWIADDAGLSWGLFVLAGLAACASVVLALMPTHRSAVA